MGFSFNKNFIHPHKIRLEVSTACQLNCPSCPTAAGEVSKKLGTGFLKFADFKQLLDKNPWITGIELSNWGEIFLNKELSDILKYAHQKHVAMHAINGANLNTAREEDLEAIVKYKMRSLTCSIDGATQETYELYRKKGNFDQVISNIKTINVYKNKYHSKQPLMIWQFVAFGHNEHEISRARALAKSLNRGFKLKLSWGDLYLEDFSPVRNPDLLKQESGLDVASRAEYREKYNREYIKECCLEMWTEPQINYDGRVLGCPVNYWGDYGNAFNEGVMAVLNNEKMSYARAMLMGRAVPRADIPCCACKNYQVMKKNQTWVTTEDLKKDKTKNRLTRFAQSIAGHALARRLMTIYHHNK